METGESLTRKPPWVLVFREIQSFLVYLGLCLRSALGCSESPDRKGGASELPGPEAGGLQKTHLGVKMSLLRALSNTGTSHFSFLILDFLIS